MEKTLNLDPDYRPTASEAMEHPYFHTYHDPDDEPVAATPIDVDIEQDLSIGGVPLFILLVKEMGGIS